MTIEPRYLPRAISSTGDSAHVRSMAREWGLRFLGWQFGRVGDRCFFLRGGLEHHIMHTSEVGGKEKGLGEGRRLHTAAHNWLSGYP
jgi:hypothetical protein